MKRPGILIPVFFLSLFPTTLNGQLLWQATPVAALGGAYVTRPGFSSAAHNQAGLGWIEQHSVTLQHSRPFIIKELGVSSISGQLNTEQGALGAVFTSYGIVGLRQSSSWISYGMKLHSGISAGLGIHLWTWSIPEKILHQPGVSFALGIQARINKQWMIGAHVLHPAGWSASHAGTIKQAMLISVGISYIFFHTATCYLEIQLRSEGHIQLSNGIEWSLNKSTVLMIGFHNRPFTCAAGISVLQSRWILHLAFQYIRDAGTIPFTSLHYAW